MPGGFASLLGSDSEPDFDSFDELPTQPSRTMAGKPRSRPAANAGANRITKPAQRGGRAGGGAARQALQERNNNRTQGPKKQAKTDPEEEGAAEDEEQASAPPKRGRPKAAASTRGGPASKSGRGRPPKAKPEPAPADDIPEMPSPESMEIDGTQDGEGEPAQTEDEKEATPTPELADETMPDIDGDDLSVRRKLGDLTKRYESLEARHKELRDVGVKEAERNYERLKKQSEENTTAANKLIAELKAEIAAKNSVSKRLEASENKNETLQAKVNDLDGSLSTARAEIKTLTNKLAAARNAEVNSQVPGSALKKNAAGSRNGPSAEVMQAAQAKEDLYGDLTGLIIRGMKQEDDEDVFDCIQTGRNGTLHFKLGIDTGSGDNYEDVQFSYRPQLDEDRDRDLIDLLPDFLVEDISFARPQASNFYRRMIKSLTE